MDEIREVIEDGKVCFKMRVSTKMEEYRWRTALDKEPETISWLKSFDPHDVFFDVGANVGIYSLYAASLFPEMEIVAFEPMPANFKALCENSHDNGFYIYCQRHAVGNFTGYVHLHIPENESGKSGAQMCDKDKKGALVNAVKIDDLKVTKPANFKIDIDGQELEVVKGMQKTLPHIKSILIEVHPTSKGPIVDILTAAGFTTDNRFNTMSPHSRERRAVEGIPDENIVFAR